MEGTAKAFGAEKIVTLRNIIDNIEIILYALKLFPMPNENEIG